MSTGEGGRVIQLKKKSSVHMGKSQKPQISVGFVSSAHTFGKNLYPALHACLGFLGNYTNRCWEWGVLGNLGERGRSVQ